MQPKRVQAKPNYLRHNPARSHRRSPTKLQTMHLPRSSPPAMAAKAPKKIATGGEDKVKVDFDLEVTELLGSVTTQNCPGTRTSARVIQKMKQDQSRPLTPPPNEREHKKDEKNVQKTPSQPRAIKPTWTNLERNHFFDALNEYGKDFEAIGNYINAKLKRKSTTDSSFKTKDQVRQHYFQTYHKIYKYIKFSDEIKKPVQELYALINYGEMRRKLQFVTDKHFMKLKNLVYQGYITVRCKGKNIRVKTPSCKALRKLNQLDDSLEDIRLPSKIEVIVGPANMESFGRVQTIAQNPRARTTVPLHKKLVNFIKTFQYKWRSAEMKLAEAEAKMFPDGIIDPSQEKNTSAPLFRDPEICFLPKPGVTIHRPLLNITEYLSSVNICLSAYEERMHVKVRSDTLVHDRNFNKRPRTDSGSEKRSPDTKKHKVATSPPNEVVKKEEPTSKTDPTAAISKSESSGDELFEELNELLADPMPVKEEPKIEAAKVPKIEPVTATVAPTPIVPSVPIVRSKRGIHAKNARPQAFKPLISEDVIKRIREGWTISNAADITIGDLYVILGQDSKLELEYYWSKVPVSVTKVETNSAGPKTESTASIFTQKQSGMPYNPNECDDPELLNSLTTSPLGNKLKHLLLIANLSERIRKRQCSCGHTCERYVAKTRFDRQRVIDKSFVSNKTFPPGISLDSSGIFRQPFVPIRRPIFNMDPVKQLTSLYRSKMSRETLVQRLLLPDGDGQTTYGLIDLKNFPNRLQLEKSQDPNASGVEKTTVALVTNDGSSMHANPNETEIGTYITLCGLDNVYTSSSSSTSQHVHHSEPTHLYKNDASTSSGLPLQSFNDNALDDCSNASLFNGMSPMHLLRESNSNSRWLEENLNDFSLTSLLGHLDGINSSRDILDPSSNLSVISESSVDYRQKFQEITALMQNQDKD